MMSFIEGMGIGKWGLFAIVFFILLALLGPFFVLDQTENSNRMDVVLANARPGTTFKYVLRADERRIYVDSVQEVEDSILIYAYTGFEDISTQLLHLNELNTEDGLVHLETYILGTDQYGRDYLSRLVLGARVSLMVGFLSVLIALCIGVSIGSISGYYGGRVDVALSWFMNVFWTLPTVLIVVAISFGLGKGLAQIILAIGCSTWVDVARLVRGQVLGIKQKEFIQMTKILGLKDAQIIIKHILPNCLSGIIILSTANFASAILLEAGLSFLGFGVNPPTPSWGAMIKENYGNIVLDSYYLAIVPGIAILLVVFAFNVFANGLKKVLEEA